MPITCALTQSLNFINNCADGPSSLDEVLLIEYANVENISVTANVVTAIDVATGKMFRRYVLDKDMGFDEDPLENAVNGSLVYRHKIEFDTKGQSTAVKAEMKLVAKNRLIMIVKRYDGSYWLYGRRKGMNLDAAYSGITKESNGRKGHTWTFTGTEPEFALEVDSTIITGLLSAAS